MALEINRAPVLTGKAAKEFQNRIESTSAKESKAEIEKGLREFRVFMAKQKYFQNHAELTGRM